MRAIPRSRLKARHWYLLRWSAHYEAPNRPPLDCAFRLPPGGINVYVFSVTKHSICLHSSKNTLNRHRYCWLVDEGFPIYRFFKLPDLEDHLYNGGNDV